MPPISAVIITKNEAAVIERCIDSVSLVADEIVVVDAESTDDTATIAEARGAVVSVRAWQGYASARNHGLGLASNDFIVTIDADEVLSSGLVAEILSLKPTLEGVYTAQGLHVLCGRWIQHSGWRDARKTFLFDRRVGRWERSVHEGFAWQPGTTIHQLQQPFVHYAPRTLAAFADRVNRYTTLESEGSIAHGKRVGLRHLTLHPLREFLRVYVRKQGYRDGFTGYCIAVLSAFYKFLWMAKLWESTRIPADEPEPPT